VLVVDDETEICELLASYLGAQGIAVAVAENEAQMQLQIDCKHPDVILLDVNLGPEDGFAIARKLRRSWQGGLLMVTGRGDTVDRVVGLELGADDYITKPFELRELLARVRSVGRRAVLEVTGKLEKSPEKPTDRIGFDKFSLCQSTRELQDNSGVPVLLTTGEFDLLCIFVNHVGQVLSRDTLLQRTRNRDASPFDRTIDVQVGRLRKKLGDNTSSPRIIKSIRGAGYVFCAPVSNG
jgi:two-component system, OmpR family, response regulator